MYALNLIVISALVCCVLSESKYEILARRYCSKECDNVNVMRCANTHFPMVIALFKKCSSANGKDLKTVEEINHYYCKYATEQEFFDTANCAIKEMFAMHKPEEIAKAGMLCLEEYKC